jgi:hypothetical protein
MTIRISQLGVTFALAALVGCRGPEGTDSKAKPYPSVATQQVAAPANGPHAVLDTLDTRAPVPLVPMMANHQKQNMREHLAVVQEIVAAVAANDFAAIEKAAGRIGYTEEEGAMCKHMGAGASGFTEAALHFHHTADSIAAAAKQQDAQGVLTALSTTLSTCTGCHSRFKQQVVDDVTWAATTKQPAPTGAMHQ